MDTYTLGQFKSIVCPLCERATKLSTDGRIRQHFANGRQLCSLSGRKIELLVLVTK